MSNLELIDLLKARMAHNHLVNYIVPGVVSSLIGGKEHGKVRMFTATRDAVDFITPHSHRFDFSALVLAGCVENTLYHHTGFQGFGNDAWCGSTINQVCGADGLNKYEHVRETEPSWWSKETRSYGPDSPYGTTYTMTSAEIHSVVFKKGTVVLFFEGPELLKTSKMLEPWVNGKVVPTFKTEDWMFEKIESLP